MRLRAVLGVAVWMLCLCGGVQAADYCPTKPTPKRANVTAQTASAATSNLVAYPPNRAFLAQCGKPNVPAAKTTFAEPTGLAAEVKTLFSTRCTSCHAPGSKKGSNKFSNILDVPELTAKGFLIPGNAKNSSVLSQVLSDDMPQTGDPLTQGEKELIANWITAGAPALSPTEVFPDIGFISEADKEECLLEDLKRQPERDQPFYRYLTLTHLFNAKRTDEIRQNHLALARLLNSLSWNDQIHTAKKVDGLGSILRIDLRDYNWTDSTWTRILAQNPYGVKLNNKKSQGLYGSFVGEQIPHVRGDWLVFSASRPPLYHDILDLPGADGKNGADLKLEKFLNVNVGDNIRRGKAIRAGARQSGVSFHNRVIERHDAKYGVYWKSYDFETDNGDQNIFDHPLDFQQNGGEMIFSLPNSMHAYMLIDAKGKRIDSGPTTIVHHDKRPEDNSKVLNGLSCFECHQQGMNRVKDQIRDHATSEAFSENERRAIFALYGPKETLEGFFKNDEDQFAAAHAKAGVSVKEKVEPIFATSQRFEQALSEQSAAAELGLALPDFQSLLRRDQKLLRKLALGAAFTIDRTSFNKEFGGIIQVVQQGNFVRPTITTTPSKISDPAPKIVLTSQTTEVFKKDDDLSFIRISGGKTTVGSPSKEFDRRSDEALREVTVDAVNVQFIEVTQRLWKRYVSLPEQLNLGDELPVTNVSWTEITGPKGFLEKLNRDPEQAGAKYRLPTEEEWETAARAGTETAFSFGESSINLVEFAWFERNAKSPQPAATRQPNPAGIFDMHGNVSEWTNTRGYKSSDGDHYVIKGGNYLSGPSRCRSASRGEILSTAKHPFIGFRLVKESTP